jgi:chitodextrinase
MAAPSYMPTGVLSIDCYAAAEAAGASAAARERGVDPAEVAELSAATVGAQEARIRDLTAVLACQGVWSPGDGRESGLA